MINPPLTLLQPHGFSLCQWSCYTGTSGPTCISTSVGIGTTDSLRRRTGNGTMEPYSESWRQGPDKASVMSTRGEGQDDAPEMVRWPRRSVGTERRAPCWSVHGKRSHSGHCHERAPRRCKRPTAWRRAERFRYRQFLTLFLRLAQPSTWSPVSRQQPEAPARRFTALIGPNVITTALGGATVGTFYSATLSAQEGTSERSIYLVRNQPSLVARA